MPSSYRIRWSTYSLYNLKNKRQASASSKFLKSLRVERDIVSHFTCQTDTSSQILPCRHTVYYINNCFRFTFLKRTLHKNMRQKAASLLSINPLKSDYVCQSQNRELIQDSLIINYND